MHGVRRVDLVHSSIHHDPHVFDRTVRARVFGDGQQRVDRQHRLVCTESQALRHGAGRSQASECSRTATEGNGIDFAQANARPGQQLHDAGDQSG